MDVSGFDWAARIAELVDSALNLSGSTIAWLTAQLAELQARYPQLFSPQTLFGLIGTTIALWKWWEAREANLFRRFEEMIAREKAQLVRARNDLLEVMIRPGPGVKICAPLFADADLKQVLRRQKWHPSSLFPIGQKGLDDKLERAVQTCNRKVAAHLERLSLFRQEIASARLIQGAIAAGRAVSTKPLFERQGLDLEAFDRFREVLSLPGHRQDPVALELVAQQLARMEGEDQRAIAALRNLISVLQRQEETYSRNVALARAKRMLAVLRYPLAPAEAQRELSAAINILMRLGPPRDRHLLELAEMIFLSGTVHLRLGAHVKGPRQLRLAQTYYRNLLRSLLSRRRGLFRWMYESSCYSGHRTKELIRIAQDGLARCERLLHLSSQRGSLLIKQLRRGRGVPRHNRKPPPLPKGR